MESDKVQEEQKPSENAVDISLESDGGILKEILRDGEGHTSPSPGDTVFVHYVGTLTNGEKFDSSRDRGEKFEFQLGRGKVIKAWDQGVATMKRGELAKFWCKPEYAYGEAGAPPKIPPNATLVFEVELFDWKGDDITENKDGGIIKHEIKKGEGYNTPNDGAMVNIHYSGLYEGKVFEERDVEFEVGEGSEKGVVEGLEIIAKNLKNGEKARFDVSSQYAYGATGNKDFNIPAGATVEYEVEMKSFEKVKEGWEMDTKEKLEQSDIAKSKGTTFFKAGNYKKAIQHYQKIVSYLEFETSLEEEDQKKRDTLMLASHLNLAMCYLKTGDSLKAVEQCDKALEFDKKSAKALFRRGQARFQTSEYEVARVDYEEVLKVEPDNKAARNQIVLCNQKIKQFKEKQKKIYAGMFTKFAERDAKNAPKVEESSNEAPETEGGSEEMEVENGGNQSSATENTPAEPTEA
ncbi:peptidyl-prolyl cis-trans isomerase FKBP4-like [Haliotis asinina]|uniref:peptidyl-prolyl cis-trans isomerase FKBP4-like n=1 Tax=Haliotis asinina TaxID=109174 RepID=UPI0035326173